MSFRELESKARRLREAALARRREDLDSLAMVVEADGTVARDDNIGERGIFITDADLVPHQEQQRQFDSHLDYLMDELEKCYALDRHQFTTSITLLGGQEYDSGSWTVYGQLRSASDDWMRPVLGLVRTGQWTGPAAETFERNFLTPFNDASELQMACVRELTLALACFKEATIETQDKLVALVGNAIAKLEEDSFPDVVTVLNWVSLVTTAAGYALGPNTLGATSLGAGALSMILDAASREPGEEPEELEVVGHKAVFILESLAERYAKLKTSMLDFDHKMHESLRRDMEHSSSFGSSDLELSRPEVADRPDQFGRLEITAAAAVPIDENPVVESIVDLYRSGEINLPHAAGLYSRAARTVEQVEVPSDPPALFWRAPVTFRDLQRQISAVMSRTADSLTDAGAALAHIAQNYELCDEERAEAMRQIGEMMPPETGAVGLPA